MLSIILEKIENVNLKTKKMTYIYTGRNLVSINQADTGPDLNARVQI